MKSYKCNSLWNHLDEDEFQSTFRMSRSTLVYLKADLDRMWGAQSEDVEPGLLLTVWLLGNTKSFESAKLEFELIDDIETTFQTYLRKLVPLSTRYIKWPDPSECKRLCEHFRSQYEVADVLGAVGSLHVPVDVTGLNEALRPSYYNESFGEFTVILQIVCDRYLLVRNLSAGRPGGGGAKETLKKSMLFCNLLARTDCRLLGGTEHAALDKILTPFDSNVEGELAEERAKFNALHSKGMSVVEDTFVHIHNRFPRIRCKFKPDDMVLVTSVICMLHNLTQIFDDNLSLYK